MLFIFLAQLIFQLFPQLATAEREVTHTFDRFLKITSCSIFCISAYFSYVALFSLAFVSFLLFGRKSISIPHHIFIIFNVLHIRSVSWSLFHYSFLCLLTLCSVLNISLLTWTITFPYSFFIFFKILVLFVLTFHVF